MMNEMMDRVDERIVEHVEMALMKAIATSRCRATPAGVRFGRLSKRPSASSIWSTGPGRTRTTGPCSSRATVGSTPRSTIPATGGKISLFVCPNCLEPDRPAIPLHQWTTSFAGASAPAHQCR